MVWIRRVRTTSGGTAVQVVESVGGRRRIVTHVGTAHDEAGLGLLVERARQIMAGESQDELDLAGRSPVTRAGLLAPAPGRVLFPESAPVRRRELVAAPQVLSTCSDLLFRLVAGVYDDLGFVGLGDGVFRDLVVARVVEPASLLDVDRVLGELGQPGASLSGRKRALKRCLAGDYRGQLAGWCFAHAGSAGDLSLVLYDVTTLRTQAAKEDEFRKVGYSKDRSVDPQVVVGLLVDRGGFPLEVACFDGKQAETDTIVPMIEQFTKRHGITDVVIVADAGMLSKKNLTALDEAGYRFIVGSRMVKAPIDLASHFRWHGDAFSDGQIIDTLTPKRGRNRDNNPALKAEPVWGPKTHPGSWRAVWEYSQKRYAHDIVTLTAQENRARAAVDGDKPARRPRFVKASDIGYTLDEASIARARKLAGLKGYVTNMPASLVPALELIGRYHDLWHVEQSFRMSKSDLGARPLFARRRDAIEAHLTITFAALAVARTIQHRTGRSIRYVIRALRPLRSAVITSNGVTQTIPSAITPDQQAIIDAVKTRQAKRH